MGQGWVGRNPTIDSGVVLPGLRAVAGEGEKRGPPVAVQVGESDRAVALGPVPAGGVAQGERDMAGEPGPARRAEGAHDDPFGAAPDEFGAAVAVEVGEADGRLVLGLAPAFGV